MKSSFFGMLSIIPSGLNSHFALYITLNVLPHAIQCTLLEDLQAQVIQGV